MRTSAPSTSLSTDRPRPDAPGSHAPGADPPGQPRATDPGPAGPGPATDRRHPLHPAIRQDLVAALRLEATAHAGYRLAARQARTGGHADLAGLFERFADPDCFDHVARTAALVGTAGSDADQLRDAARAARDAAAAYRKSAGRAQAMGDQTVREHFALLADHAQARHDAFTDAVRMLGA